MTNDDDGTKAKAVTDGMYVILHIPRTNDSCACMVEPISENVSRCAACGSLWLTPPTTMLAVWKSEVIKAGGPLGSMIRKLFDDNPILTDRIVESAWCIGFRAGQRSDEEKP